MHNKIFYYSTQLILGLSIVSSLFVAECNSAFAQGDGHGGIQLNIEYPKVTPPASFPLIGAIEIASPEGGREKRIVLPANEYLSGHFYGWKIGLLDCRTQGLENAKKAAITGQEVAGPGPYLSRGIKDGYAACMVAIEAKLQQGAGMREIKKWCEEDVMLLSGTTTESE